MSAPPTHKSEQTGNAALDRIQNNVRQVADYLRNTFWLTKRGYAALDAAKTASGTYADLLSATITTVLGTGFLLIQFSASGIQNTSAGTVFFKIRLNGVDVKGLYKTVAAGYSFNVAMLVRTPVAARAHTVTVQWKTNVATATIDPVTTLEEHASLWLEEAV